MSADRELLGIVQEIEALEGDIRDRNKAKSDIYKAAADKGYDKKAIRKVVAARRLDPEVRNEQDDIFDTYMQAVERAEKGFVRAHVENIEKIDRKTRAARRMSEAVDDTRALSAEAAALGLIDPDAYAGTVRIADAIARKYGAGVVDPETGEVLEDEFQSGGRPSAPAEQAPRLADESGVSISPETATECAAPEKEAVADERDVEATVEQRSSASDFSGSSSGRASGFDPDDAGSIPAPETIPDGVPAFLTQPNKPLRPHCLNPGDGCAGYGDKHCHSCLKAMKEEAA